MKRQHWFVEPIRRIPLMRYEHPCSVSTRDQCRRSKRSLWRPALAKCQDPLDFREKSEQG